MSSNQTGEVIKVLTLFTIITTPMMLIGTWYGMNFVRMPELEWHFSYALVAVVTVVTTAGAFFYFKMKKWF
jgi:magnesium transporter